MFPSCVCLREIMSRVVGSDGHVKRLICVLPAVPVFKSRYWPCCPVCPASISERFTFIVFVYFYWCDATIPVSIRQGSARTTFKRLVSFSRETPFFNVGHIIFCCVGFSTIQTPAFFCLSLSGPGLVYIRPLFPGGGLLLVRDMGTQVLELCFTNSFFFFFPFSFGGLPPF